MNHSCAQQTTYFQSLPFCYFCIIFFLDVSGRLKFLFVISGRGLLIQYGRKSLQVKRSGENYCIEILKHPKIAATFRHGCIPDPEAFNSAECHLFNDTLSECRVHVQTLCFQVSLRYVRLDLKNK